MSETHPRRFEPNELQMELYKFTMDSVAPGYSDHGRVDDTHLYEPACAWLMGAREPLLTIAAVGRGIPEDATEEVARQYIMADYDRIRGDATYWLFSPPIEALIGPSAFRVGTWREGLKKLATLAENLDGAS